MSQGTLLLFVYKVYFIYVPHKGAPSKEGAHSYVMSQDESRDSDDVILLKNVSPAFLTKDVPNSLHSSHF